MFMYVYISIYMYMYLFLNLYFSSVAKGWQSGIMSWSGLEIGPVFPVGGMGRGKFFPFPLRLGGILFSGWGCEASFLMPFFLLSSQVRPVFCFLLWKSEYNGSDWSGSAFSFGYAMCSGSVSGSLFLLQRSLRCSKNKIFGFLLIFIYFYKFFFLD